MRTIKKLLCSILFLSFAFNLIACEKNNTLDLTVYLKDTVNYQLGNDNPTEGKFSLSDIINSSSELKQYSRIQITTKKDWTYGLELERIEFDIILSMPADIDIDITLSNLENGAHFNESQNTYYFQKTLSINKENTSIKLDINDIFTKKDSCLSIEINDSCYKSNGELKIGIANLKMYGQHTEARY